MVEHLRKYLRDHNIGSVLLGLSGGPDSMLTFHLLKEASKTLPNFKLGIAHANFRLRGEESQRDELFVKEFLSRYPELKTYFIRFDTEQYCKNNNLSIEMGARELRHRWFDEICSEEGYQRIATGHNADDNEETLLLNLLRGSGSRGLRGMEYDNGRIIRPILRLSREKIIQTLEKIGANTDLTPLYITDSSNLGNDYRRNYLRHEIIPLLEKRWPGAHTALQSTLHIMAEENRIVEYAVEKEIAETPELLSWEKLKAFPSPFTLIFRWISPMGGSSSQAAEMTSAIGSDIGEPRTGGRWQVNNIEIRATKKGLVASPLLPTDQAPETICEEITLSSVSDNDSEKDELIKNILSSASDRKVYLPGKLSEYEWRHPSEGEKMKIRKGESKRISHILKEAGVTPGMRGKIWLLAHRQSGEAVWIPGIRRGYSHKISPGEINIFSLSIK